VSVDGLSVTRVGPDAMGAPTLVILLDGVGSEIGHWIRFQERLAESTRCGVVLARMPAAASAEEELEPLAMSLVPAVLAAGGFGRGVLMGSGTSAAIVASYLGGTPDHRVRGLVLISPRLFVRGSRRWDAREAIGYVRVPIQIVEGAYELPSARAQIEATQDEAYCPVDVALIDGAGGAPVRERPDDTLAAVVDFVETLFRDAGEGADFPMRGEA